MRHKHVVYVPQARTPLITIGLIMFAIFQNKAFLHYAQAISVVDRDYIFTSL